jgi:hypothetical protein
MSTEPGGKLVTDSLVRDAQQLIADEGVEQEQLDLLEPLTAEELAEAQETLGHDAGPMAVVREARAWRRGRPQGVRNRRTDDFVKYLSQFGPDPAVVLAQMLGTPEEAMVERSYAMDPVKRRLSYGDARAMRIRAAEALMPYWHGKQPVRVDATIRGVIVQEQIGSLMPVGGTVIDGEPVGLLGDLEDGDDRHGA